MLEAADGPQVLEVNSSPGLEGIEAASGVDIAGAMLDYLLDEIQLPDIDLRQRLSLRSGYGVAEFQVDKKSKLANKTIAETELRNQEVMIVNIDRGGLSIPAPHGGQKILIGDKLLCFGKTLTLKSLIPPKKKRRTKKLPVTPGEKES